MIRPLRLSSLLQCAALAFASLHAADAHALGPIDVEVAAKAGYGTNPSSDGGPNPLGFGLGGRGGLVLFGGLYAGVNGMYYVGDASAHAAMYGGELGYGFKLLLLTIRPQVGVGNATFSFGDASPSNLYVEPGVTAMVTLAIFFVGVDANALVLPGLANTNTALTAHGQVGLTF